MNKMLRLSVLLTLSTIVVIAACGNSPDGPAVQQPASGAAEQEDRSSPVTEIDSVTVAKHARIMRMAAEEGLAARPIGEVIQRVAEELIGVPYIEHMLDQDDSEHLVVSLAGFDCVLFNEAVVALAQAIRARDHDIRTFARNVESLRYRGGEMVDYCSRLHYYSDWLRDNHRRGNVRIITEELVAAEPFDKSIYFMTENRGAYRRLGDDDAFLCIAETQDRLNEASFMYVPQERIEEVYDQLLPGDVLALTTSVGGLDIAHTGIVYRHADGRVGMIHASTTGQVKIDPDLASYVRGIRIQNGMMVARAQDRAE